MMTMMIKTTKDDKNKDKIIHNDIQWHKKI